MAFALHVKFEGVLGWVPDTPLFKEVDGRWVKGEACKLQILMPDLREQQLAGWETLKPSAVAPGDLRYRASHVPVLLVDPKCVRASTIEPHGEFRDLKTRAVRSVYLLDRFLVYLPELANGKLTFDGAVPSNDRPPDKGRDRTTLWWMPRLAAISADARFAHQQLLDDPPWAIEHPKMAARVIVDGGHLSTTAFNTNDQGTPPWVFKAAIRDPVQGDLDHEGNPYWELAIGNVFTLAGKRKSTARITLEASDGDRYLDLRPRGWFSRKLEITIANVEPEVLFMKQKSPWGDNHLPDPDFEPFFAMSSETTAAQRVPVETAGGAGPSDKPCASGAFDGIR